MCRFRPPDRIGFPRPLVPGARRKRPRPPGPPTGSPPARRPVWRPLTPAATQAAVLSTRAPADPPSLRPRDLPTGPGPQADGTLSGRPARTRRPRLTGTGQSTATTRSRGGASPPTGPRRWAAPARSAPPRPVLPTTGPRPGLLPPPMFRRGPTPTCRRQTRVGDGYTHTGHHPLNQTFSSSTIFTVASLKCRQDDTKTGAFVAR